jgi:ABC-2 type transport system ATP-binding protein
MKKVLDIQNITKKLGKKTIISDISFSIDESEVFGLVGPNGAGKSTIIKVMLGLYKGNKGTVKINGYDISKDFEKAMEHVGAIIENPECYDYLSAKKNMEIFARMYKDIDSDEIERLLKLVKLDNRKNSKVKTYSLGMKQRLGIAISLLSKPNLLVLDEPTNGLDPLGIKELRELIQNVSKKENMAVFISSHILSEIELVCDRIGIIDNGKLIEIKSPKDIKKTADIISVSFVVDDETKTLKLLSGKELDAVIKDKVIVVNCMYKHIPVINKLLINNGISVYEINISSQTLEDEFVKLTSGSKGQIR